MNQTIKQFNTKVQVLNQSSSKQLLLTAKEARDLQFEIANLLIQVSDLERSLRRAVAGESGTSVSADGGRF